MEETLIVFPLRKKMIDSVKYCKYALFDELHTKFDETYLPPVYTQFSREARSFLDMYRIRQLLTEALEDKND
jgi:hypothetical protein